MTTTLKIFTACIGLLLPRALPAADEPAVTGRTSPRIKTAILAGLPSYRAPSAQAAAATSLPPADPDAMVLPVLTISSARKAVKTEDLLASPPGPLVAGTGVTQIKLQRTAIAIPRLFYIPIGFKLSW